MCPTWRRQFTWGVPWKIHSVFPESFSALTPGNHETASVLCMQTLPWYSVIAMNSRHIGLTHEIMFFSLFSYTHCQWYTIWLTEGRNYIYSWCHYLSVGVEAKNNFYIIYCLNGVQKCCLFHLLFDQGE